MKAMIYTEYGPPDVLRLEEVEKPVPKENEVLIKVYAASVNAGDWHLLRGDPFLVRLTGYGLREPKRKILGWDLAGRVETVGAKVTQIKPGDEVFGCGNGTFAEFASIAEETIVPNPPQRFF